jgi:hypothetical protein
LFSILNWYPSVLCHKEEQRYLDAFSGKCFKLRLSTRQVNQRLIDMVIVGSDQVWRPWPGIYDYSYFFLGFIHDAKIKKASYAASLGLNSWTYTEAETREISKMLLQFSGISVREKDAVSIFQDVFNLNVPQLIDPTLLLKETDYRKIIPMQTAVDASYVATFILDATEDKQNIAELIAKSLGKKIVSINATYQDEGRTYLPSIESWLDKFIHADFVITDSFHGTAFSINFNKKFVVISNEQRGQSRLTSILELFSLQSRLVCRDSDIHSILSEGIDWDSVNLKLNRERERSSDYFIKLGL